MNHEFLDFIDDILDGMNKAEILLERKQDHIFGVGVCVLALIIVIILV